MLCNLHYHRVWVLVQLLWDSLEGNFWIAPKYCFDLWKTLKHLLSHIISPIQKICTSLKFHSPLHVSAKFRSKYYSDLFCRTVCGWISLIVFWWTHSFKFSSNLPSNLNIIQSSITIQEQTSVYKYKHCRIFSGVFCVLTELSWAQEEMLLMVFSSAVTIK